MNSLHQALLILVVISAIDADLACMVAAAIEAARRKTRAELKALSEEAREYPVGFGKRQRPI